MYINKVIKDSESCAMQNYKKSKADYAVKTLRLPWRKSVDDVRMASHSSSITQCLSRMVYVKDIDQYMPPKGVNLSADIIQCYKIKESRHYIEGDHGGVKAFLYQYDRDYRLSNLLYNKARLQKGVKHVAFFPLVIIDDGKQISCGNERIIICFKCLEPSEQGGEDVLLYDTAYHTKHPSPALPGDISYLPNQHNHIIECNRDQYNAICGL